MLGGNYLRWVAKCCHIPTENHSLFFCIAFPFFPNSFYFRYNFFLDCTKAKSCTVILRGSAEQFIAETERSLHDAIMIVRRAKKNDTIVAGLFYIILHNFMLFSRMACLFSLLFLCSYLLNNFCPTLFYKLELITNILPKIQAQKNQKKLFFVGRPFCLHF